MKQFFLWVLVDKRGVVWRYTDGTPVTLARRQRALFEAAQLDSTRGWRPAKVVCRSAGHLSRHGLREK